MMSNTGAIKAFAEVLVAKMFRSNQNAGAQAMLSRLALYINYTVYKAVSQAGGAMSPAFLIATSNITHIYICNKYR